MVLIELYVDGDYHNSDTIGYRHYDSGSNNIFMPNADSSFGSRITLYIK